MLLRSVSQHWVTGPVSASSSVEQEQRHTPVLQTQGHWNTEGAHQVTTGKHSASVLFETRSSLNTIVTSCLGIRPITALSRAQPSGRS